MNTALATVSAGPLARVQKMPLFEVPLHDTDEFLSCADAKDRARVRELFAAFRDIASRPTIKQGAAYAAGRRRHLGRGWEARTLKNLYSVYVNGGHKPGDWKKEGTLFEAGDWRCLLRAYKKGDGEGNLPQEFIDHWRSVLAEFKGRKDTVAAAYKRLIHEQWLAGVSIPGYGTIDEWCARTGRPHPNPFLVRPGELPESWSARNLRRYLPKRRATRAQLAHGVFAAHTHQPDQVLKDRSALRPFEFVYFDDLRVDKKSLWRGEGGPAICYPLKVLGLDAATGVDLVDIGKPQLVQDDGRKLGITRNMTRYAIVEMIRRLGLPPWKMTIVLENAAAALTKEDRAILKDALGDRIEFEDTAVFRERMLERGFVEQHGCPWSKAPIEAFFRVLQTRIAHGAGTTGPRYDLDPGTLAAEEKYALSLLADAQAKPQLLDLFRFNLPTFDALDLSIGRALKLLRFRHDHALQGFDRVVEWRRNPQELYQPLDALRALPEAEQDTITDIIERLESPAERFCRLLAGCNEFERPSDDMLTWLGADKFEVTVRDGKIAVKDSTRASVPMIFREAAHTLLEDACEGDTYQAALAADASYMVLGRDGQMLGSVSQQRRVSIADKEGLRAEAGRVRAARVSDRELIRGYTLRLDEDIASVRAHNEAVRKLAPTLPSAPSAPAVSAPKVTSESLRLKKQHNQAAAARSRRLLQMQEQLT